MNPQEGKGAGQVARNMARLAFSLVVTMSLALVLKMYLPRQLGPEAMGTFYFAESFSNMFFSFLPLGIGMHIAREVPPNPSHAGQLLPSLLAFELAFGLVIMGVMTLSLVALGYDAGTMGVVAIMGAYSAFWYFQREIFSKMFIALERVKLTTRVDMAVKAVLVASCVSLLFFSRNLYWVAFFFFLSEFVGFGILLWAAKRSGYSLLGLDVALVRKVVLGSLPFFVAGVLTTLYTNLDLTMVSKLASTREVGLYGSAVRLKGIFLLLAPIVTTAFIPPLSRLARTDFPCCQLVFGRILAGLAAASLVLGMGLLALGDVGASLLYGSAFTGSHRAVAYLAPVVPLTYLNILSAVFLNITTKGKRMVLITAASLGINAALNAFFIPWGLERFGDGGAGAGTALASVVSEAVVAVAFLSLANLGESLRRVSATLCLTLAPMFVLGATYDLWCGIWFVWRGAALALFIPAWCLGTGLVRPSEVRELFSQMRNRG